MISRNFNGVIDDVRLYSRALSVEEINDLPGLVTLSQIQTNLKQSIE